MEKKSTSAFDASSLRTKRKLFENPQLSDKVEELTNNMLIKPQGEIGKPQPLATNPIQDLYSQVFTTNDAGDILANVTGTLENLKLNSQSRIEGSFNDALNDKETTFTEGAVFRDIETDNEYVRHQDQWYDADGNIVKSPVVKVEQPIAEESLNPLEEMYKSIAPVPDDLLKNEKTVTEETSPIQSNTSTKPEDVLADEMRKIAKQQIGLDTLRATEYLTNAFAAMNQPRSEGFVAPEVSAEMIPSTRDRDLSDLERMTASSEALMTNRLTEQGQTDLLPAIQANMAEAEQRGRSDIANRELQVMMQNMMSAREASNANIQAKAMARNQNIEKTMNENAALGAEYTGNMENFFRTATDINRQRNENAIVQSLVQTPETYRDVAGMILSRYGLAKQSNKKVDEDNAKMVK